MSATYSNYAAVASAPGVFRRISWGAIFAGVAVAMVTQLILNLLGLAIGASTIDPATSGTNMQGLGIGAAIWLILSAILAFLAGGWVAGRLAGFPTALDSSLHGLITFAVVTLLTFYMLTTTIGSVLSGTANAVGGLVSAAGQTAGAMGPEASQGMQQVFGMAAPQGEAEGQIDALLRDTGVQTTNPQAVENVRSAAQDYVRALVTNMGNMQAAEPQRQALVDAVANNTTMSRQDVENRVNQMRDRAQQTWDQTKQQAAQAGEAAAEGVAATSFGTFLALVLGGAAAVLGAWLATPRTDLTGRYASVDRATEADTTTRTTT